MKRKEDELPSISSDEVSEHSFNLKDKDDGDVEVPQQFVGITTGGLLERMGMNSK